MPIILDILVIAILVLFIVLGAHRGFILTLCSLVAVIVALVGANLLADALAPKMAQALEPRLEQSIQQALEEKAQEVSAVDGLEVADAMAALREKGGLYEWAADSLEEALKSAPVGDAIAHQAAAAATAVAEQLARGVLFSVAFLVILVAWFFLSHALDLVAKLPGLSTLNQTLGGILGLVKGLLILWLLSWILGPLTGVIAAETVAQTHLLLFLTQHGPLELLKLGASLTA
ncbi:CvpA family protein [Vermiculatibacterium agrestimuris]|uniref:CvpA family protein n=1 Tax=Vermiculatibacterium agrestimuris TaxID=2941519 RepID=UPI00203CCACA|nr:CvpA family protein [Vermiculatibacterium agrestimuris]